MHAHVIETLNRYLTG